jgi:hypothetical protein
MWAALAYSNGFGVSVNNFYMKSPRPEAFRLAAIQSGRVSVGELLELHGDASGAVLLLVLSALCVVPVYGLGSLLSLALLAIAWRWRRVVDPRQGLKVFLLPQKLTGFKFDEIWSRRCLTGLARLYELSDRLLRPRWGALASPVWAMGWGFWIALMAVVIFLPLPLGNVLPSLSLVLMSLGWMYRDGVALALSLLAGLSALLTSWLFVHLIVVMVYAAWSWLLGLVGPV